MYMKKNVAAALIFALLLTTLAGCGGSIAAGETPTPAGSAAPTDDTGRELYSFAAGRFTKNAEGYADAPYEYELPISATDETLSFWTVVWTPQYVPAEGYGSMDYPRGAQKLTGVNIDYVVVSADSRAENFSVLLASDDLPDIVTQANAFYSGSAMDMLEDGWFVNLCDYADYCPNYFYQATFDKTDVLTRETVFYSDDTVPGFYAMLQKAVIGANYQMRGDWLQRVGLTNDDLVTWDDLYNALGLFKSQIEGCDYPWPLLQTIDMGGSFSFTSYDTLPYMNPYGLPYSYVPDGSVVFALTGDRDKAQMEELTRFYRAGLIDPNWTGYANNTSFTAKILGGQAGYVMMSPGEVRDYETGSADPNAIWAPVHKPLRHTGQVLHLGGETARVSYGSSYISAKCANIELACSWCDWRYSPSGSFYASWGPEGALWEYDENHKPIATEWALNNPQGLGYAWLCMLCGINSLAEHGLEDGMRKYAYEGGDRLAAMHDYWADCAYDGLWEYPAGARLNDEETAEATALTSDISTYISENYGAFLDGSKPMAEWDAYVAGLDRLGMDRVTAIYQDAYDRYKAA